MHILLVEDDPILSDGLIYTLKKSGYTITSACNGRYAEQFIAIQDFDIVVLDLGLPDIDGLELLRRIRRNKHPVPVLILTARDDVNDKIEGIKQGADDYLTKPFELRELEARIQALIRRCYGGFSHTIQLGDLIFDTHSRQLSVNGIALNLSARELAVLEALFLKIGTVVAKDKIAQRLSVDGESLADNAIEVYIHRIRKHIEPYGVAIKTVRGLGYLLDINHA